MTSRGRQLLAIPAAGAVIAAVVAVAILPRVGGPGLVRGTSSTPSVERSTDSASPDARPTRSADHTPGVSPNPTRTTEFEFVRFRGDVTIMSEPGGGEGIETTWEGLIAPVIGRADVDGEGWIGVQFGSFGVHHRILFGWVPVEADLRGGDSTVRGRTYEPVTVECPGQHPDVEEILRLLPAQALACYGSNTLTFTPVLIRDDPDEEGLLIDGEPEWLAVASDHAMYAFGPDGWTERGSMRVHVDPASGLSPPDDLWVELDGHFDHPASADCTRSSEYPEMGIGGPREMVLWCRERFVITGIRELGQADHPRPTPFYTPGPPASGSVEVDLRRIRAPFPGRSAPASVWTGTEMIAWGGYTLVDGFGEPGGELTRPTDGVAYDPVRDTWRRIPDAPIEPLDRPMSAWTGHEMLVWGGAGRYRHMRQAGATYDPALDSWRALPEAPLSWENEAAAVWTGTEWLIAAERDDEDASSAIIEVAAYDPATDAWRSLPQLELRESTWLGLAWTGTEPILSTGGPGVYRLRPGANAWERIAQHPAEWLVGSTMTWTGDRMLGIVVQGGTRILASWDPVSDAWEVPAVAPHDLGSAELIWTGDGAVLLGADLAFDPVAESWLELKTPWWAERYLGVAHWTGDALVVWGGSDNSHADTRDDGVVLVPQW